MTNVAYELGNQLREKLISSNNISSISYESLLIMGMGGSGVAGDVLKLFSNSQVSICGVLGSFFYYFVD